MESPAQSGRMRTLIHRGPISRGYVTWIVLRPLIASMATLALNSGLWVRRLLIGWSPVQGQYPVSEVNDGAFQKNQSTSVGTDVVLPRGKLLPKINPIEVRIVEIIQPPQSLDRASLKQHTALICNVISRMLNQ